MPISASTNRLPGVANGCFWRSCAWRTGLRFSRAMMMLKKQPNSESRRLTRKFRVSCLGHGDAQGLALSWGEAVLHLLGHALQQAFCSRGDLLFVRIGVRRRGRADWNRGGTGHHKLRCKNPQAAGIDRPGTGILEVIGPLYQQKLAAWLRRRPPRPAGQVSGAERARKKRGGLGEPPLRRRKNDDTRAPPGLSLGGTRFIA